VLYRLRSAGRLMASFGEGLIRTVRVASGPVFGALPRLGCRQKHSPHRNPSGGDIAATQNRPTRPVQVLFQPAS
jgi:hypothetical protein